ncbi:MAG: replication factor C small subunit [Candidatus Kariarchaeum pelagius]|jgi:replication factor C small subunit|nr:replication factor C small subunit [Candidatus Heimdallarchaeota archaeon]|tara:strand:+ start:47 stop:1000 length:954 start_codon:yes stop_codon:yes gene_type:complete
MSFDMMWIEKYRPKTIDEIIGQDETKTRLKGFVESKSLPHLLFAGPPGTGKTSTVITLATEIFGEGNISGNLLELNASDDRGIDIIRNEVKDFAKTLPIDAPFKIISLDEADALTSAAQHALRRTMEKYVSSSRFVLLCNYPGKIIEPIQSRCAFFRFQRLGDDVIKEQMEYISKQENVDYTSKGLDMLVKVSNGDLRKAINVLQATAATGGKIEETSVLETVGGVDPNEIEKLLNAARNQEFDRAKGKLQDLIFVRGVAGSDIIREINSNITKMDFSDESKLKIIDRLAEVDFRLTEGASPDIQIAALLAHIGTLD